MGRLQRFEEGLVPAVRYSRYEFAPVHQDELGRTFLDVPDPLPKRVRRDDIRVVSGAGDTLHSMAWRAYKSLLDTSEQDVGPSRFYWVVGENNGIVNPTKELPLGSLVRIPSLESLVGEILVAPRFFARNSVT